ncbi:MAG: hypothetical protein CMH57_08515 [Myxococcales bacterium]|nr:hypothetical protein [Myxococcales bacterium]
MKALRSSIFALTLAVATLAALTGSSEANAADHIDLHAKFWSAANTGYDGQMTDIDVVFLDDEGKVVDAFSAYADAFSDGGEYTTAFYASYTAWVLATGGASTLLVSSNELTEEYGVVEDVNKKSYFLTDNIGNSWGGIWDSDAGGNEPKW